MTLSDVPRYESVDTVKTADHAVVLEGGISGFAAARVLSDWFEEVTLLDRDSVSDEPVERDGVRQSSHPHVMLSRSFGHADPDDCLVDLSPSHDRDADVATAQVPAFGGWFDE